MLSKRLQTIYDLVDENSNLADIGADHGFLLIELAKNNKCNLLLGVENKKGPYEKLLNDIRINSLKNKIFTSFSDGLSKITPEYKTIVIAGIGTDNIKKIIKDSISSIDFINTFIIDSHTKIEELRKFVVSLGFKISQEKILKEDNIVYEIIRFDKGSATYSDIQYKFGPCLIKEKTNDFINIYKERLMWLKNKRKNTSNPDFIRSLELDIKEIEAIIYENQCFIKKIK